MQNNLTSALQSRIAERQKQIESEIQNEIANAIKPQLLSYRNTLKSELSTSQADINEHLKLVRAANKETLQVLKLSLKNYQKMSDEIIKDQKIISEMTKQNKKIYLLMLLVTILASATSALVTYILMTR